MKIVKLLFPILLIGFILYSCVEEYEEPTGNEFKGTFVWKYTDTLSTSAERVRAKADTLFIEVKETEIRTYVHALRDTSASFFYVLSSSNQANVYTIPLSDEENKNNNQAYKYYATYRFSNDSLYLETFPLTSGNMSIPDPSKKPEIRRVYTRPRE